MSLASVLDRNRVVFDELTNWIVRINSRASLVGTRQTQKCYPFATQIDSLVGLVGDWYDNVLAEAINGLYKAAEERVNLI